MAITDIDGRLFDMQHDRPDPGAADGGTSAAYAIDGDGDSAGEPYFRIGDLAQEFDVSLRTLRFYEDKGLLSPKRVGVTRLYTKKDRARLKLILLGKRVGFSLTEVKRMIELYDPREKNQTQMKVALEKGEAQLAVLKEQQVAIETAIAELSQTLSLVRAMIDDA